MQIPKNRNSLSVKIIPRSKSTEFIGYMEDGTLKIRLRAIPEHGKANDTLLRFLYKETGKNWEILSGFTHSRKFVKIIDKI